MIMFLFQVFFVLIVFVDLTLLVFVFKYVEKFKNP